jgi:K+-transporting ATPase ATPase C chain
MGRYLNTAIRLVFITLVLFGVIYPLVFTGIAQVLFPTQANGSLVAQHGAVVGSALIGQPFVHAEYFHPRPSAAGTGYDATNSGGANLGPTSVALSNRVTQEVASLIGENPGLKWGDIPVDMVTSSASGLDADITPANAYAQAARIATARGVSKALIAQFIARRIIPRQFGLLGEPRLNVLDVNRALDIQFPVTHPQPVGR